MPRTHPSLIPQTAAEVRSPDRAAPSQLRGARAVRRDPEPLP